MVIGSLRPRPREATVLIVNSDETARERILALLQGARFEAVAAASAAEAIEILRNTHCDALVVDFMLDDKSGFELLRCCAHLAFRPVTVMTAGRGEIVGAVRAMREGVSDFLPAPYDGRLVLALRRALSAAATPGEPLSSYCGEPF